jgi:NAD-dependent dihydropyrimidine dehydrogenase PreA subunit
LVGAELPSRFLKSLGLRLENEWSGNPVQSLLLVLTTLAGLWFGGGQTGAPAPPIAGCTRNCQVGIDVMSYAIKKEVLDNDTSCCIGCGICVSVCPMDVLSFSAQAPQPKLVQIQGNKAA